MIHYNSYLIDSETQSILKECLITCFMLISNRALTRKVKKALNVSEFKSITKTDEMGISKITLYGSSVYIKLVPL